MKANWAGINLGAAMASVGYNISSWYQILNDVTNEDVKVKVFTPSGEETTKTVKHSDLDGQWSTDVT